MYKTIVAKKTAGVFDALNKGDAGPLMAGLADGRVQHIMYGEHCLGGMRHTPDAVRRWYERLFRLLPGLRFDLDSITVMGPPWKTRVAVEWHDTAFGGSYSNRGVNIIELAWGKVSAIRIHCDSQALADMLADRGRSGTAEATAAQILDE